MIAKKHPYSCLIVRNDGCVYIPSYTTRKARWTFGHKDSDGYLRIFFKGKQYRIHRLVAETFIDNPQKLPTVDHINRIRTDNRVENLRWATRALQSENNAKVLNRKDYGVRSCEDRKKYYQRYNKERYERLKDEILAKGRAYYKKKREEGFTRVVANGKSSWMKKEEYKWANWTHITFPQEVVIHVLAI